MFAYNTLCKSNAQRGVISTHLAGERKYIIFLELQLENN